MILGEYLMILHFYLTFFELYLTVCGSYLTNANSLWLSLKEKGIRTESSPLPADCPGGGGPATARTLPGCGLARLDRGLPTV